MSSEQTPPANRLVDEDSSYLRRHAYQPVDWYPWGEQALARAVAQDRPILLSIGYASNRWCARMERESFEDERTAAFMNARFVCVKVDRQQRPDVDAHYLEALQAITGEAAYPVTIFLTPQGKPFYGGSYFPPEARDGLPAFSSVLNEVAVQWQKKREDTCRRAQEMELDIGRRLQEFADSGEVTPALLQRAVQTMQAAFDEEHGGFAAPPKFPQATVLEFMLRASARGAGRATKVARLTLGNMARGGIYDQLGGGFHRFSVDAAWQVPHFEKMLYDNAAAARLYTHAWQLFSEPLYRRTALDTLEYLLRDMADPGGAFYAGEGSDSEGTEGRFYTWSWEELEATAPGSAVYYGATRTGNFHGVNVLTAPGEPAPGAMRAALMKRRSERSRPVRDQQILTSWNGLAIAALAEAGAAFDRPDLVEAARRAASWLLLHHRDAATARLFHSYRDDRRKVPGMLEDYAYLAEGLYVLWEVTFEPQWLDECDQLCRQMLELFWDPDQGGLFTTGSDHEQLLARRKDYLDPSTPSAAAVAAQVLYRMAIQTGSSSYSQRGARILEQAEPRIQGLYLDAGAMVCAMDTYLSQPTEIVVIADPRDGRTRQMLGQIWESFHPYKLCAGAGVSGRSGAHRCVLLAGKQAVEGNPTAFVTQGGLLRPPITDPGALAGALRFWPAPSASQMARVKQLIGNALQARHFFDNLQSPAWIQPLDEAGLFDAAPGPILDYVEETVGSPPWPQSRYLVRMAPLSPGEVQQVALKVNAGDNVQVHEDLADIALALPAQLAAAFVPEAARWLASPYQLHLPGKLGRLIGHLAEGGRTDAGLDLARILLEVQGAPASQAAEPRARFNDYDYQQILTQDFPALVAAAGRRALEVLCDLLDSAIRLSFDDADRRAPNDMSYLWRPAIHPSDQNADKTLRNTLTSATVEAVEQIARSEPGLVPEMVKTLQERPWCIFRRIALHLLRVWPEVDPPLITSRLTERELFDDPHFHHEYLLLARDHWEQLGPQEQQMLWGWIGQGPDPARWGADPHSPGAGNSAPESTETYRSRWQLKRLSALREYLPSGPAGQLSALEQQLGEDPQPDFVTYHPPRRPDPTTPVQADELHYQNLASVLDLLASWSPTEGLGNPTIEGLARKLAQVVATEPVQFGRSARRFKGLHPLYIRALLQGLREGSESYALDWPAVLDLCAWTVEHSEDGSAWRLARVEVALILSRGFTQGPCQMPVDLRTRAWQILRPLTEDPDPAGGTPADTPASTVRGEGMHAVIRYALWLRRDLESGRDARMRLSRGFDEMPEVRGILEAHLDPKMDTSFAVRAVYGRWFAWLAMLDGAWAQAQVDRVFPQGAGQERLRDAAWEALVSFSPPYDHLLAMLGPEYERGVGLVSRFDRRVPNKAHPESRLAEHLMVFYLRGRLPLDEKGLLFRFFAGASDRLRSHALGFVGRSLNAQKGALPMDFVLRLRTLWEKRIRAAESSQSPAGHAGEMAAFGWWFASGKLEKAWSLQQLRRVLELGGGIDAPGLVVAALKDCAQSFPAGALEALNVILTREQDSVSLLAWAEDARVIIDQAMGAGDPAAQATALELLRFFDVRELEELVRWE